MSINQVLFQNGYFPIKENVPIEAEETKKCYCKQKKATDSKNPIYQKDYTTQNLSVSAMHRMASLEQELPLTLKCIQAKHKNPFELVEYLVKS